MTIAMTITTTIPIRKHMRMLRHIVALTILCWCAATAAWAQEDSRSALQVTVDEDGDVAVVCDTESIRMTILPGYQACISNFVFKPSGNDIFQRMSIKFLKAGMGLLQDNFWEQDWRYSEFRHKWYDFKIISRGPEELAVKFWTTSVGWLQANDSGVISDLLSNIKIEKYLRMPVGKPFFMMDYRFSIDMSKDETGHAKMPQFWWHNGSLFTDDVSDEYQRPHILGIAEQTPKGHTVSGDYVYSHNLAEGWSAHTSPRTKEGIVYLMDPQYLQCIYNCGNSTCEWFGDNMLITRKRPIDTRVYILPVIGIDRVHFADPHMILRLTPKVRAEGEKAGTMDLKFSVLPSYRQVRRIVFDVWATYGLHERQPKKVKLDGRPTVRNLRVESPRPASATVRRPDGVAIAKDTPLLFDVTANIELLDEQGRLVTKKRSFQYFHLGAYPTGKNLHLQGREPLAVMDRVDIRPWIPSPPSDLVVDRSQFKIFTLVGPHGWHYRIPHAIAQIRAGGKPASWDKDADAGYSVGFPASQTGLSNFPYDYERLFGFRVFINCNTQTNVTRLVGQSILANYIRGGGGYVSFGGEAAYCAPAPEGHQLTMYDPVEFRGRSIVMAEPSQAARLRVVAPKHPVFKGVPVENLPYAYSWHDLKVKTATDKPFLYDPFANIAMPLRTLPKDVQDAVAGLPAERRTSWAEISSHIWSKISEEVRGQLVPVLRAKMPKLPEATLTTGSLDRARAAQIDSGAVFDVRRAFAEHSDEHRAGVYHWLDWTFDRPNVVSFLALPANIRDQTQKLLLDAAKDPQQGFVVDQTQLLLTGELREQLAGLVRLRRDELPREVAVDVLIEVVTPDGPKPFLVELYGRKPDPADPQKMVRDPAGARSMAFLNSPFGDKTKFPKDHLPYWEWDQWERLVANVIVYAGREL